MHSIEKFTPNDAFFKEKKAKNKFPFRKKIFYINFDLKNKNLMKLFFFYFLKISYVESI